MMLSKNSHDLGLPFRFNASRKLEIFSNSSFNIPLGLFPSFP